MNCGKAIYFKFSLFQYLYFNLLIIYEILMSKQSSNQQLQPSKPPSTSATASKKTYENVWRIIFLLISLLSTFLFNKIPFDLVRKGQFMHLIVYGVPFAFFFSVCDWIMHYLFDQICENSFIDHKKYSDPDARKKRCYTLVKWGYSIVYYATSSLAAYLLLKNTSYFPTWLGGSGSPMNIYNDFPENSQFSLLIQVFYICQFGKHISRTFSHLFIRPQGNYYEYALHHALSVFLILFSYLMDHWLIGTFVLLIHDFTDTNLIVARAYKDYKNKSETILKLLGLFGFISWVVGRIVIFFYAFIYSYCHGIINILQPRLMNNLDPIYEKTMFMPSCFMAGMLIVLWVLQLFWTYYIVKTFISLHDSDKVVRTNNT